MTSEGPDEIIRKHALKNAFDYGKANAGAVAGKVIAEYPDVKKDMKSTMALINKIITEINALSKNQIEEEMKKYAYAEKKQEEKELEVADAVNGKVVVRYPPEPNGWPHIGHAKAFCLSWAIAHKYNGKIILRWDDTNPEAEKAEFVEAIRGGIKWLGLDWQEEKYCSDYIPKMYELCEKLIDQGDAYFCACSQDEIAKSREEKRRCACGQAGNEQSLSEWKKMLDGTIAEGKATIRLKGNMESQNTVMRDPTLFRILTTPHYRQGTKYRVWPTYDFQGAVMDSILGITHPIRSKEYELRDELYVFLLEKLGLQVPKMISISRLQIKNTPVSKRLLRPLVESGKLWGWDDPRLPTLAGLNRRGILPEAIRNFVLSLGISKSESEPDWDLLLAENRKLLDPISKHYFFVRDPVTVIIKGLDKSVRLPLHPKKEIGFREFGISEKIYICADDAKGLKKNEIFRLKDLCNVQVIKKGRKEVECELLEDSMVPKKIQWVSAGNELPCTLFITHDLLKDGEKFNRDSLETAEGYCEKACEQIKEGEIIQFERVGFCRSDKKDNASLQFVFSC